MDIQKEAECLCNVPMFAKLDPSKLKLLAFTSQLLDFDDGEVLFRFGDRADCAYVIIGGEVEILSETDAGVFVAGVLGKNELVGEMAILTNSPRSATIRARGEVVALRIAEDVFLNLLAENSEVALDVMRQLSQKLARSHHQFEELQRKLQRLEANHSGAPAR